MPPIPTERLALDIRELRVEIREARSDFHDFKGRAETALAVITWGFCLAIPALVFLWLPMAGLIWYAAKLDSKVSRIEASLDRLAKIAEGKQAALPITPPSKP